jgi:cytochrome oxidase Cu insertion factor (SCO1/SenC/PrrC family)
MRRSYGDKLPDIPVIDHRGNRFRLFSDLVKDKAVVISFFYTNCEDACPVTNGKLTQMRKELKKTFGRSIQILSISVDGDHDTPEKVARYARSQGIESSDPDMPEWKFLTGSSADIFKVRETIGLISNDVTRSTRHQAQCPRQRAGRRQPVHRTLDPALRHRPDGTKHGTPQAHCWLDLSRCAMKTIASP